VAVPVRVALHSSPQLGGEIVGAVRLWIECDDERLVLGVDQMVGAGRADLAYLGCPRRGGERDRLRASVDLEHDAVRVGEEGAAERGKGSNQEGVGVFL